MWYAGQVLTQDLSERVARMANDLELDFVAVFGSTARGRPEPGDLDLALSPCSALARPPRTLWRDWAHELMRGDLDLVWLPSASWLVQQQVAFHGRPLFERSPGKFRDFYLRAILRSADSDTWRRRERAYLEKLLNGGFKLEQDLVHRKSVQLGQYLKELEEVLGGGRPTFESTPLHYAGERLLELLVECAAYINTEVAQSEAGIPPSDYYSSFFSMAQTGWISSELASELAPYTRLRNVLVHRYEELALETLYDEPNRSLSLWREYLRSVVSRLS